MTDVTLTVDTYNLDDNTSDYGDFGEDITDLDELDALLATGAQDASNCLIEAEEEPYQITDIEDYEPPLGLWVPKNFNFTRFPSLHSSQEAQVSAVHPKADYKTRRRSTPKELEQAPAGKDAPPDTRSPLERFRAPPKKALSVTDLVSPSWCELQYYYVLSKHGRKKRTPAMKQGSAVHKALEDEVHVTVPIETTKIEDSWGLRLWNICQGLKTLRQTGRTRELEVWGILGGEVVNGIIDELSYECPDPSYVEENSKKKLTAPPEMPEAQTSIEDFMLGDHKMGNDKFSGRQKDSTSIYLIDVKTRATPTLPTGSSVRPTVLQLHLYHHMLENMIQNNFRLHHLTSRYNLDANEPFSDSFLAQLGSLNQEFFEQESSQTSSGLDPFSLEVDTGTPAASQDSMDVLLQHNNLETLWSYMMKQLEITFLLDRPDQIQYSLDTGQQASQQSTSDLVPPPAQPTRLSPLLTAEYLASTYKHTPTSPSPDNSFGSPQPGKKLLGRKHFMFNPALLKAYLQTSLAWWRGERSAEGVCLQEAWKCRSCEFRADCEWIHQRDQESLKGALERKKMREVAGVEKVYIVKKHDGAGDATGPSQSAVGASRSAV